MVLQVIMGTFTVIVSTFVVIGGHCGYYCGDFGYCGVVMNVL